MVSIVVIVDFGFGRAQCLENLRGYLLRALADCRGADDPANLLQAAAMWCDGADAPTRG